MRNIIYLGFFILNTNYQDLKASFDCCHKNGYSMIKLFVDMIFSALRYGSSFVDYFNFRFYEKNHSLKKKYATMGFMYKFHKSINDQSKIKFVDSKELFPKRYGKFCNKSFIFSIDQKEELKTFLNLKICKKIVIKDPNSTAGKSIRILLVTQKMSTLFIDNVSFSQFVTREFIDKKSIYIEDFVSQHSKINSISPSGLNTVRVITLLNNLKNVSVIGSVFRISVDSPIDNYSAGNLAAEVDPMSGIVLTGGIRKRSACDEYHDIHPITGIPIKGFKLPFWEEVISMVKEAALIVPQVRTIGWDVAITDNGCLLIEGNSQWNKDTWQIPAGYGKKHIIAPFGYGLNYL